MNINKSDKYEIHRLFVAGMLITLLICSFSACMQQSDNSAFREGRLKYGVFIGANPDQIDSLDGYEIVVIDATYYSKMDIDKLHRQNTTVYSYLNIGSIEDFRDFFSDNKHLILDDYENWPDEYWVNVSDIGWQNHIQKQAALLLEKDVDGFFIDNIDVYYQYHTPDIYNGLATILNNLGQFGKDIIINGGDVFVVEAIVEPDSPAVRITGVNQECVFTGIDFKNEQLVFQSTENTVYYQEYLEQCKEKGLDVYLLEYSDHEEVIPELVEYCNTHQFHHYVSSSIDLN